MNACRRPPLFSVTIPGIGPVASSMLVAEMPEIGTITGEEAAALTGLAPVAHDSGTLRGK
ncbi:IS110 family transposase [Pseudotabrizicola sediminis]|uniref:IS110 family transposase n=1 Tax=Pseudotabrizicola sediminis TaxID=2486418 RepID=A0ABY2KGG0_9RHOB|nr:IS110 family transposase [Pseudotabrizicola sediminis]